MRMPEGWSLIEVSSPLSCWIEYIAALEDNNSLVTKNIKQEVWFLTGRANIFYRFTTTATVHQHMQLPIQDLTLMILEKEDSPF